MPRVCIAGASMSHASAILQYLERTTGVAPSRCRWSLDGIAVEFNNAHDESEAVKSLQIRPRAGFTVNNQWVTLILDGVRFSSAQVQSDGRSYGTMELPSTYAAAQQTPPASPRVDTVVPDSPRTTTYLSSYLSKERTYSVTTSGSQSTSSASSSSKNGNAEEPFVKLCRLCREADEINLRIMLAGSTKAQVDVNAKDITGQTPLGYALLSGKTGIVRALLRNGATALNVTTWKGGQLIRAAIKGGYTDIALKALKERPDLVKDIDDEGNSLLHSAVQGVAPRDILIFLVDKGVSVNATSTRSGATPLWLAAEEGNHSMTRWLLEKGAEVDKPNNKGVTPLTIASTMGYTELVLLLLRKGGSVHIPDKEGRTAVYQAAACGHPSVVEILIAHSANIHQPTTQGSTPLNVACKNGKLAVVQKLVKHTSNINQPDFEGNTPLNSCCGSVENEETATEIVQLLLSNTTCNVDQGNNQGWTPLNNASYSGFSQIVAWLLERGADPRKSSQNGVTPLNSAAYSGDPNVVAMLLQSGKLTEDDLNLPNGDGVTPLFAACHNGHDEVVQILVQAGTDVNSTDPSGFTPLAVSCSAGSVEICGLLLEAGADINVKDGQGWTPLVHAAHVGCVDIVDHLVNEGAEVQSSSALMVASQEGHVEVVQFLMKFSKQQDNVKQEEKEKEQQKRTKQPSGAGAALSNFFGAITSKTVSAQSIMVSPEKSVQSTPTTTVSATTPTTNNSSTTFSACCGDSDVLTPLHIAAVKGDTNFAKALLQDTELTKSGTDKNGTAWTPLHSAAEHGQSQMVTLLVARGENINAVDVNGWTAMHVACHLNHVCVVSKLLQCGACVQQQQMGTLQRTQCKWGSPLQVCSADLVDTCITAGCGLEERNSMGMTPLLTACRFCTYFPKKIPALLKRGANPNVVDHKGFSALHYVCEYNGNVDDVTCLIRHGVDIHFVNTWSGLAPKLIHSLSKCDGEGCIQQQQVNAHVGRRQPVVVSESSGYTTEMCKEWKMLLTLVLQNNTVALQKRWLKIIEKDQTLWDNIVNMLDETSFSLLMYAAIYNLFAAAECLIQLGADPDKKNWYNQTASLWSKWNGNRQMQELFGVDEQPPPDHPDPLDHPDHDHEHKNDQDNDEVETLDIQMEEEDGTVVEPTTPPQEGQEKAAGQTSTDKTPKHTNQPYHNECGVQWRSYWIQKYGDNNTNHQNTATLPTPPTTTPQSCRYMKEILLVHNWKYIHEVLQIEHGNISTYHNSKNCTALSNQNGLYIPMVTLPEPLGNSDLKNHTSVPSLPKTYKPTKSLFAYLQWVGKQSWSAYSYSELTCIMVQSKIACWKKVVTGYELSPVHVFALFVYINAPKLTQQANDHLLQFPADSQKFQHKFGPWAYYLNNALKALPSIHKSKNQPLLIPLTVTTPLKHFISNPKASKGKTTFILDNMLVAAGTYAFDEALFNPTHQKVTIGRIHFHQVNYCGKDLTPFGGKPVSVVLQGTVLNAMDVTQTPVNWRVLEVSERMPFPSCMMSQPQSCTGDIDSVVEFMAVA